MSIRNVDLNSEGWRNLVFKGRNKEYGAYYLRKTSSLRHLIALSIVISGIIILIIFSKIIHFNVIQQTKDYEYVIRPIELSDLIWLEENRNNPIKEEEKLQLKDIVKSSPPVITKDENIEEDLKKLPEVNIIPDTTDISSTFDENILSGHLKNEQQGQAYENGIAVINKQNRPAVFQDGRIDVIRYIYQNIDYPSVALKQRINGRVICSFVVNEDGSISDVTLIQGVYIFLDEEVIRVIRSMPLWRPATKDGKAIKIKYIVPVVFRLN